MQFWVNDAQISELDLCIDENFSRREDYFLKKVFFRQVQLLNGNLTRVLYERGKGHSWREELVFHLHICYYLGLGRMDSGAPRNLPKVSIRTKHEKMFI